MSACRSLAVRVRMLSVALCAVVLCVLAGSGVAHAAAVPTLGETWVTDIAGSSATLQAQIDPEGSETSYRFEYGTSEAYGSSVPVPEGSAGAGTGLVTVEAHTQSLAADTTYHFRVVAMNAGGTVSGADHTFTTQSAGGELTLPDGREWELVSPAVKDDGWILPLELEEGFSVEAAADGDAMTYEMTAPPEASPAGNANATQMLSTRGPGGWSSRDITPPQPEAKLISVGGGQEYKAFSSDLEEGIVAPIVGKAGEELLSPQASEYTIYLHDNMGGAGEGYVPLVWPGDVPSGTKFGGIDSRNVHFEAATPDLSHVVFSDGAALTSIPVKNGIYEWSEGHLELVNILPGGHTTCGAVLGGTTEPGAGFSRSGRGAVSADGSRVFWTCGHLYVHVSEDGVERSVQLDTVQGGTGAGEPSAVFQFANSDGSRVFFEDSQVLTADAGEGPNLYECDIVEAASGPTCELSDLTVDEHPGERAGPSGVLGASEDGSYVYFLASGALAPGASPASCGFGYESDETCNLYLRHNGVTMLVAALSDEDAGLGAWSSITEGKIAHMHVRVSPNGRYLAFMSDRSLTGYDNRDVNSGLPDEEVFLYDAESNHLVCASCNPTGARPAGRVVKEDNNVGLFDAEREWIEGRGLAANVPGWKGMSQPRFLSDSGQVFFNSSDELVPQDTNGTENVYEYEPVGVGGCTGSSAGFSERSAGCVGLISSGDSAEESIFLDASESGEDVFFLTDSKLAPQDFDDAYDVYDAHECSAASPCPLSVAAPPPCTTADSCRAAPSPQPAVFGAPSSATFSGVGNLTPPVAATPTAPQKKSKPKARHRSKGAKRKRRAGRHSRAVKRSSVERRARGGLVVRQVRGGRQSSAGTRG